MASEVSLIFPFQLFSNNPALRKARQVILIEESLFFRDEHHPASFHQKKLVMQRAAMKAHEALLKDRGYGTLYIEYEEGLTLGKALSRLQQTPEEIHICDLVDHVLERRLKRYCKEHEVSLQVHDTPMFLSPPDWLEEVFGNRKKKFLMADFYSKQRQRLDVLVESDGSPVGGKWSFDEDNRKKLPRGHEAPDDPRVEPNDWVKSASDWVSEQFSDNPGSPDGFRYPVTHKDADQWLDDFLEHRFQLFGDYEDAISSDYTTIYHSVISPMLNSGLLTPDRVIEKAIAAAEGYDVPLNSLEGFVRQIIGWREFMMGLYRRVGVQQRTSNFWEFTRDMPDAFYDGTTGIDPVDMVIKRTLEHGYCHHIERLMIIGNFMCLCGIRPDAVYQWFMDLYVDAWDWVMVPNVYGMSQFADGGLITTKPYVSGSNYVKKMSNFGKDDWNTTWDGLFWSFIAERREFFEGNPRLAMMTKNLDRMGEAKLNGHQDAAEMFLDQLT